MPLFILLHLISPLFQSTVHLSHTSLSSSLVFLFSLWHRVSWFLLAPSSNAVSPFASSQTPLDDWSPCWGVVVVVGPGCFSRGSFSLSVLLECPHSLNPPSIASQSCCHFTGHMCQAPIPYLILRSCQCVTSPETVRASWKRGCRQLFRSPEKT